ncbi:MAG: NADH-quinone oxidoreductase subunit NuoE [Chloroflexi bacterium]|nr:MAG: NADH-quinone oxidoreductase subunit NuoE [Chloroflexota bacterium]
MKNQQLLEKMHTLQELYGEEIEEILSHYPDKRSALLPLLWLAQEHDGWISETRVVEIAQILGLDPTEVRGVGGFYHLFYFHPVGKHTVRVCDDIVCALKGADRLLDHLCDRLDVDVGETTADGEFTVERTGWCVAACDHAPAVLIDDVYFGPVDEAQLDEMIARLRAGWQPQVDEGIEVGVVGDS